MVWQGLSAIPQLRASMDKYTASWKCRCPLPKWMGFQWCLRLKESLNVSCVLSLWKAVLMQAKSWRPQGDAGSRYWYTSGWLWCCVGRQSKPPARHQWKDRDHHSEVHFRFLFFALLILSPGWSSALSILSDLLVESHPDVYVFARIMMDERRKKIKKLLKNVTKSWKKH